MIRREWNTQKKIKIEKRKRDEYRKSKSGRDKKIYIYPISLITCCIWDCWVELKSKHTCSSFSVCRVDSWLPESFRIGHPDMRDEERADVVDTREI